MHPCYAGDFGIGPNPKLLARVKGADLVLLIGGRFGEMPSQSYSVFDIPEPQTKLVHVHPGAEELGRVYHPHLAINAAPTAFCAALGQPAAAEGDRLARRKATPRTPTILPGARKRRRCRAPSISARSWCGCVKTCRPTRSSRKAPAISPAGSIAFIACANSAGWSGRRRAPWAMVCRQHWQCRRFIPIVLSFAFAGDGDFLMTGQDFATAVQYELPVIVLVADNGIYGTIRMHQERDYPGRVIATNLRNPDFAAYALAFGGYGAVVEKSADFPAAFAAARASGKPSIIHLKIDPEAITPTAPCGHPGEVAGGGGGKSGTQLMLTSPRRRGPITTCVR